MRTSVHTSGSHLSLAGAIEDDESVSLLERRFVPDDG